MLIRGRGGIYSTSDIVIRRLAACVEHWRSGHILPADVTALHRRWPKAVFKTLSRLAPEVERLRRGARNRSDRAFRHNAPGRL